TEDGHLSRSSSLRLRGCCSFREDQRRVLNYRKFPSPPARSSTVAPQVRYCCERHPRTPQRLGDILHAREIHLNEIAAVEAESIFVTTTAVTRNYERMIRAGHAYRGVDFCLVDDPEAADFLLFVESSEPYLLDVCRSPLFRRHHDRSFV